MQIRLKRNSTEALHELSTDNGGININNDTKVIELLIPKSITTDFDFKVAYYDLELTKSGVTITLATGLVLLDKQITK
jgi:hypothetical protein